MSKVEEFDAAVVTVTQERGKIYGDPLADFTTVKRIVAALPDYGQPALNHIAYMFAVKLARLSQTPTHVDSLIDIAGYARTWAMVLDKLAQ